MGESAEAPLAGNGVDSSPSESRLSSDDTVRYYMDLYKAAVDVQKHFNDIEWRIRGLALTVATFALGAAGVAAKEGTRLGSVSVGAAVLCLGLLLWYAFYYVDRYWYHPLLKAAVRQGERYEEKLAEYLPLAEMTRQISRNSAVEANRLVRFLSGAKGDDKRMHSDHKLRWFYLVGATALAVAAFGLQAAAMLPVPDPPTALEP